MRLCQVHVMLRRFWTAGIIDLCLSVRDDPALGGSPRSAASVSASGAGRWRSCTPPADCAALACASERSAAPDPVRKEQLWSKIWSHWGRTCFTLTHVTVHLSNPGNDFSKRAATLKVKHARSHKRRHPYARLYSIINVLIKKKKIKR